MGFPFRFLSTDSGQPFPDQLRHHPQPAQGGVQKHLSVLSVGNISDQGGIFAVAAFFHAGEGQLGIRRIHHRRHFTLVSHIQRIQAQQAAELLDDWMHRAAYCKIAKVVAVEKKVRRRRDDIIAAVELGISNGRVEAINNKIKVTVRMGYGFRNTDNLVALLMLRCGDCQPQLPGRPVKARKKGVKGAKSVAA